MWIAIVFFIMWILSMALYAPLPVIVFLFAITATSITLVLWTKKRKV